MAKQGLGYLARSFLKISPCVDVDDVEVVWRVFYERIPLSSCYEPDGPHYSL